MGRLLACALALSGGQTQAAAPVPTGGPDKPALYLTTRGAKWVYRGDDGTEHTDVVTAAVPKGKGWVVTAGRAHGKGKTTDPTEWEMSERGLFVLSKADGKEPKARQFLKLPTEPGGEWRVAPGDDLIRCVTLKPRRVEVPAGEFEAVGVETYLGDELAATRLYAVGVGLVKIERNGKATLVLKSFNPGTD